MRILVGVITTAISTTYIFPVMCAMAVVLTMIAADNVDAIGVITVITNIIIMSITVVIGSVCVVVNAFVVLVVLVVVIGIVPSF